MVSIPCSGVVSRRTAAFHRTMAARGAMARALCKRPGLLVLDEPTASVDAFSEKAMFDALAGLDREMTVLLVAHRFTTIGHAENIVVLDRGASWERETMRHCSRTANSTRTCSTPRNATANKPPHADTIRSRIRG